MLYWLVTVAALVGVVLNIRRHVACFYVWAVTNLVWAIVDFRHGIPQQAALQAIYFGLSIYGIVAWSRTKRSDQETRI